MNAPLPRATSPYSIERQGAFWAICHDWHGIVLDEIESYGSAECHVTEMQDRDLDEAPPEADDVVFEIMRRAA